MTDDTRLHDLTNDNERLLTAYEALATTLEEVRALCSDPSSNLGKREVQLRYDRIRAMITGETS